jgi:hypothetical protein
MKRILSIATAALFASAIPALAQTTVEGDASGEGSAVVQPDAGGTATGAASGSVTVETDPGTTASINLSTEQQTELRGVLSEGASPVDATFDVTIGATAPDTVEIRPLPPRFVEVVPQYEGYRYFVLADGRIVIVEPDTTEIVYIMS